MKLVGGGMEGNFVPTTTWWFYLVQIEICMNISLISYNFKKKFPFHPAPLWSCWLLDRNIILYIFLFLDGQVCNYIVASLWLIIGPLWRGGGGGGGCVGMGRKNCWLDERYMMVLELEIRNFEPPPQLL